jgi:hypothetical protein
MKISSHLFIHLWNFGRALVPQEERAKNWRRVSLTTIFLG